jgi:diguanylate cyclase
LPAKRSSALAVGHVPPTPANYQACYNEIAGLPNTAPFPEQPLRQIALALTAHDKAQAIRSCPVLIRRSAGAAGMAFRRRWSPSVRLADGAQPSLAADGLALPPEFSVRLAHFVESVVPALGEENPLVAEMLDKLLVALREVPVDVPKLQAMLANFNRQIQFAAEEQVEIKGALLKLLHLIIENIGELSLDDSWLKGQIDGLLTVVAPPLTLRHLDEMERRLRDVMVKQGEAKHRSIEAQEEMRKMLSAFIERLASMNESSASFQGKIEQSARDIEQVKRIEDLAPLLRDVIAATRSMAEEQPLPASSCRACRKRCRRPRPSWCNCTSNWTAPAPWPATIR